METISNILLTTATGALIPLGELAKIELREGPALISREGLQRRIYVGFNTLGRDIESIVVEAQAKIAKQVQLPTGYHLIWGGSFENMQRAMSRLKIIVPITIGLIFLLLFASFNSVRHAALIILNLPFALIGGIVSLWITGEYLSVPASVGFINLFGVAVLNGIVLVSYINQLRDEGLADDQAIVRGCLLRLRPVLMTALVAMLGLIPLAFSPRHRIGSSTSSRRGRHRRTCQLDLVDVDRAPDPVWSLRRANQPAPAEDVRTSSHQSLAIRTDQQSADHPAPSR